MQTAFPFFIVLIVFERVLGRGHFKIGGVYRVVDAVTSMTAGLFSQLLGVLIPFPHFVSVTFFLFIRAHAPVYTLDGWVGNLVAMVVADFFYYWFHRGVRTLSIQRLFSPLLLIYRMYLLFYSRSGM